MAVRRRIGAVSYLNARPLIEGLDECADVELYLDVPARLLEGLRGGRFDVALLPCIDYQAMEGLVIVPAGGIGCDGPTLTVRIFSRVPIENIRALAVDGESHTSIALARIIFQHRYGRVPALSTWEGQGDVDALLLIGDKVVCAEPTGFAHQLDLGQAWKELTGLAFVFAVWTARGGVDLGDLPGRLAEALRRGMGNIEQIIKAQALPRGWPADLARKYLTQYLHYQIGPGELAAIRRFHALAAEQGIVAAPARGLVVYEG